MIGWSGGVTVAAIASAWPRHARIEGPRPDARFVALGIRTRDLRIASCPILIRRRSGPSAMRLELLLKAGAVPSWTVVDRTGSERH